MRRGHGSTKVPGVKLRPSAPTRTFQTTYSKHPAWVQPGYHEEDEIDSIELSKSSRKPFTGIMICSSGVSDKSTLFKRAIELGAQANSDLTDRVTHLICEGPGSAKYKFCVSHGIPIMRPSWINDTYSRWLEGESIDVTKIMEKHRLPPFIGVNLCITAIEDIENRNSIKKHLVRNGGRYIEAIDKDTPLTHLLCGPDREVSGSDKGLTAKMQAVENLNRKRTGKPICLVWESWFWDCLKFKGQFDETEYIATGPKPGPRQLQHIPTVVSLPSTAEQKSHLSAPEIQSTKNEEQDEEEMVIVKRLPEVTTRLWEGLLKGRGFQMKEGRLMRSPNKQDKNGSRTQASEVSESPPTRHTNGKMESGTDTANSVLEAAFKRAKSFAMKSDLESSDSRLSHTRSVPKSAALNPAPSSTKDQHSIPEGERQLFVGLKFRLLGEADGPMLTEALRLRGGILVTNIDEKVDYIVVRLASGSSFYLNEPNPVERSKYRTECWIEQCIFEEKLCAVDKHPAFTPLSIVTPIPGADALKLHLSGLNAWEKTPSTRLIKAIGGTVTEQLSRKNTHLICPCGTGLKCTKALEWGIPVVNLHWLFTTVRTGTVQDSNQFLVDTSNTGACGDADMKDITNEFVQGSSKTTITTVNSSINNHKLAQTSKTPTSLKPAKQEQHTITNRSNSSTDEWAVNDLLLPNTYFSNDDTIMTPMSTTDTTDCQPPPTSSPVPVTPTTSRIRPLHMRRSNIGSFNSPTKYKDPETPKHPQIKNGMVTGVSFSRIPSSATPSPLKITSKSSFSPIAVSTSISATSSSTSIESTSSANVLREAITSLLGKRAFSDEMDQDHAHSTDGKTKYSINIDDKTDGDDGRLTKGSADGSVYGPTAKRAKPPPRKNKSRIGSREGPGLGSGSGLFSMGMERAMSGTPLLSATSSSDFLLSFPTSCDFGAAGSIGEDMKLQFAGASSTGEDGNNGNSSKSKMRVTYQNPEESNLLRLLSGIGESNSKSDSRGGGSMDVDVDMNDSMGIEEKEEKSEVRESKGGEEEMVAEDEPMVMTRGRSKKLVRRVPTRRAAGF